MLHGLTIRNSTKHEDTKEYLLCLLCLFVAKLITRGVAFDVDVGDRGDARGFQAGFHLRAIADDYDCEVIEIDVALRDAQNIFLRHR
jgi:hypothetical protein